MLRTNRIANISASMLLLFSISFGQLNLKNVGVTTEIVGGSLDVLNVYGPQVGLRIGFWPTSFLQLGGEGTIAVFMENNVPNQNAKDKFCKLHVYSGLHLRIFKNFHPYIIGSLGPQLEYSVDENDGNKRYKVGGGGTIKVGLSLEFDRLRISAETGGGTLGTGHVENNLALSYTFKSLPSYKPITDFNIKAGYHTFYPFIGPYERENISGFDITIEKVKNGIMREYNVGIFFTDYLYSTGVFNIGTGWRLSGDQKIFDYLDITPGYQILIWAEGDPDFILPAASLGVGLHANFGNFIPYISKRDILTFSLSGEILWGSTLSAGIGYAF